MSSGSDAVRGRILLVEDDSTVRGVLVFLLESFGWEVTAAADGERGWRSPNASSPT